MLLYQLLRPLVRMGLTIFFRKIHINGVENIPKNRPFVIAANHQTAFFEPMLLACFLPMPIHVITRGDVFAKTFFRKLLESMNMIPIFRFRNGFSNLRQNNESFEKCYEVLKNRGAILIFSEGNVAMKPRLRSLQKGTARLTLGAARAGAKDIVIVPIGISYTHPDQPRCEAMIEIGQTIDIQPFSTAYQTNEPKTVAHLTQTITACLLPLVVHVDNPSNDDLAEKAFARVRATHPTSIFPILLQRSAMFEREKNIANQINNGERMAIDTLNRSPKFSLLGVLLWLPHIIGKIFTWLPFHFTWKYVEKNVQEIEFKGPMLFAIVLFASMGYGLLFWGFLSLFLGWKAILVVVGWTICGYIGVVYKEL
jgi:1-acyl-sn-glycerol-3-phosphate acyltransferase